MRSAAASAAAAALIFVAAAATFSVADGPPCNAVVHGASVAQACAASTIWKPSPLCCAAVFEAFVEGGVRCLCRIPETPEMILTGLGSRFLVEAFVACGGELPGGVDINSACLEEELPPEVFSSGRSGSSPHPALTPPPPPPQAPPPPQRDERAVTVAPWYSDHVLKAIYIVGGFIGVLLVMAGLFYCIHRGGREGAVATSVVSRLLDFFLGREPRTVPRREPRTVPPPSSINFGSHDTATAGDDESSPPATTFSPGSPLTPTRFRPPHPDYRSRLHTSSW